MDSMEKEWFIQAPWGRMCVVAWGNSLDPPVLLCHGSVDSIISYRPLMKYLPPKFYYLGIELPGNGKSDKYPPGIPISVYDLVYCIEFVVRHFRWKNFIFMAHSLGTFIGRHYNICYPGRMTKVIELDPKVLYQFCLAVPPEKFAKWYEVHYTDYFKNYHINNGIGDVGSKTMEVAIREYQERRGLSREMASAILERMTEPTSDGLIRYTYDRRFRLIHLPPLEPKQLKRLFTSIRTPTLTILAEGSKSIREYEHAKFIFDETEYPFNNLKVRVVEEKHDVHVFKPEVVAPYICQFLLYGLEGIDVKAKL